MNPALDPPKPKPQKQTLNARFLTDTLGFIDLLTD